MAEASLERGSGDDKEKEEETIDLRTCPPKPHGRSLVWTQRLFLLDPKKRTVKTYCSVLVPCPTSNTINLIAHYESPRKLDMARNKLTQASVECSSIDPLEFGCILHVS